MKTKIRFNDSVKQMLVEKANELGISVNQLVNQLLYNYKQRDTERKLTPELSRVLRVYIKNVSVFKNEFLLFNELRFELRAFEKLADFNYENLIKDNDLTTQNTHLSFETSDSDLDLYLRSLNDNNLTSNVFNILSYEIFFMEWNANMKQALEELNQELKTYINSHETEYYYRRYIYTKYQILKEAFKPKIK